MLIAIEVVAYVMVGCAMVGLVEESDTNKNWAEHIAILIWPLFVPIGFAIFVLNRMSQSRKKTRTE